MKKVLIVGAGFLQRFVIRRAKELGYYTLAVDGNPEAVGFACVCKGEILAYAGMLISVDEGQITNVAVRPDQRRQGFGRVLMHALEAEARARGLVQISLEARVSNLPAIGLYEQEQYRVAGVRRNFYRHPTEDALVMLKTL